MKVFSILFAALLITSLQATAQTGSKAVITFAGDSFDFGSVAEGTNVEHDFAFTNTGKSDLRITLVSASCSCIKLKWTEEAVKPGDKGIVKATFLTLGRAGEHKKSMVVLSDADNSTVTLVLKGTVTAAN